MRRADSFEKTLMLGKIEAGGEGDDRGWDGLMASPTQWTWVWVNSRSWWWTGRPGVLQFMGSQSEMTERLNWTDCIRHAGKLKHYGYRCLIFLIPPVVHNNNNDNTYSNTRASQVALVVKNPPANARDAYLISGLGRSPGERNGNPLQCSCLENPRDGGAWWPAVSGVAKSRTWLKRLSSSRRILAWNISWTEEEPGGP